MQTYFGFESCTTCHFNEIREDVFPCRSCIRYSQYQPVEECILPGLFPLVATKVTDVQLDCGILNPTSDPDVRVVTDEDIVDCSPAPETKPRTEDEEEEEVVEDHSILPAAVVNEAVKRLLHTANGEPEEESSMLEFVRKTAFSMGGLKDSGTRTEYETGAVRDGRKNKGRFDLLPLMAMFRLAKHYDRGCQKYGDRNWEKGIPIANYMDSAIRHLVKFIMGFEDEHHLSAAIWNLMCAAETLDRIALGLLPDDLDNLPYTYAAVDDGEFEELLEEPQ